MIQGLVDKASREILLYLARNKFLKKTVNLPLASRFCKNFVAGQTLDDALYAVKNLNDKGMSTSIDHLGEAITKKSQATELTDMYFEILDKVNSQSLDSNVSLKLTQLGLDLDYNFCYNNLEAIVKEAKNNNNFVRVDMEGSDYTDRTLTMVKDVHNKYENIGTVLQSCLYRSKHDLKNLANQGIAVRLCKGAYKEPARIAYPKKEDVDINFDKMVVDMLTSGTYHGIATQDDARIDFAKDFARFQNIDNDKYEFQMLYGIRKNLQQQIVDDGYNLRVYVPFGKDWYPYFMRRLAERPANVSFVLKSFFRDLIGR